MCDEVTMFRVHDVVVRAANLASTYVFELKRNRHADAIVSCPLLDLCRCLSLSSPPLDLEVEVEVLIDIEAVWIEIVLNHVWVESENSWLDTRMEVHRHWHLIEGLWLISCDLLVGRHVICAEVAEIEGGLSRHLFCSGD
jgi:hypothetical protein